MKKCQKCKGKNIVLIDNELVCFDCSKNKKFLSDLSKKKNKKLYNRKLEEEQKENTKKLYLRFRVFVVEENING